jgi:4-hydroxy-3-polyprenylbenzoate decarboxylase
MPYASMADFARTLEKRGELVRIRQRVDPHLEVGAIADRVVKKGGPALLFENVGSSPFPLLINHFGSKSRMAAALSQPDLDAPAREIERLLHARPGASLGDLARLVALVPELASIPPRRTTIGNCQDVVRKGPEVDLTQLPILTTWPKDGGPFITLPLVITRDPDTGARNVGCYRMQLLGPHSTAMHWQVHKTGARHFRRARELGLGRLEVAVALGGDPALTYAATAPLPDGLDELMLAGFLRKQAVKMVDCVSVNLEVPADSDFVLEGYVDPSEPMCDEGPFGDHTGYYTPVTPCPIFHVTALTHRSDAVYPATIVGPPPMEDAWLGKATERIFLPMLRMIFPEIVDMNLPIEGAFHNLVLVSIKKQYPYHAARLAHGLWGAGQMMFSKVIVVFDEDVDVQNAQEVIWRALANLDPKRDLAFVDGPIDQLDHGANQDLFGGKVSIDATRKWPEEGYKRAWPEVCRFPPDLVARADRIIEEAGLGRSEVARDPNGAFGTATHRLRDVLGRLAATALEASAHREESSNRGSSGEKSK